MTIAPPTAAAAAASLLASLDPEQRAAAILPDAPALVIAPAGSGKTTTLIARLSVLLGRGVAAERIGVVTFNRDAAAELSGRIASRLAPLAPSAEAIEVRTRHAMARQVLLDSGRPVRLLPDRLPLLRAARRRALAELPVVADGTDPPPDPPDPAALDTIVSAWKVEGRSPPPTAMSAVRAFTALMDARGLIDFDDLVGGAVAALEADPQLRSRWQTRFSHLCVDEFQDVDAAGVAGTARDSRFDGSGGALDPAPPWGTSGELGHLRFHNRLGEQRTPSRRKSTSPSAIPLRIVSSTAILSSAIVISLHVVGC